MDWEYLHLITHSFPIVLTLAGAAVGLVGWAVKRPDLERWSLLAFAVGAVFVVPAYVTGLSAADVVGERTFVEPSVVQSHRTAATWASVPILLTGVLAAFALFEPDDRRLRRFVILTAVLGAALVGWSAWLGSRIQHGPEGAGTAEDGTSAGVPPDTAGGLALAAGLAAGVAGTRGGAGAGAGGSGRAASGDTGTAGAGGDGTADDGSLATRARALHERALVVDGHNDLPWRIRGHWGLDLDDAPRLDRRLEDGHTDLVRLREGGVDLQWWAAFVPARLAGPGAPAVALEQIDLIHRLAERYPGYLEIARTADDVERIVAEGRIASMIGLEGGHVIANSLPVLRQLHAAGARYMTLTHGKSLPWVDAAGDEARVGGLSDFGRAVVREMNRLGMLVDLSHVTAEAARDALAETRAPVIFSHSAARALADHSRNVPDDVLRLVAENGGIVMVNFYSGFLLEEGARNIRNIFRAEEELRRRHPEPDAFREALERWREEHPTPPGSVATIVDHIDHVVRTAGIDHVGLGSDFDGVPVVPEGMEDVSRYPALTEELLRRGYADEEVVKVLGGNFMRVLRAAEEVAAELRKTETPAADSLPYRGLSAEGGRG